ESGVLYRLAGVVDAQRHAGHVDQLGLDPGSPGELRDHQLRDGQAHPPLPRSAENHGDEERSFSVHQRPPTAPAPRATRAQHVLTIPSAGRRPRAAAAPEARSTRPGPKRDARPSPARRPIAMASEKAAKPAAANAGLVRSASRR